MSIFNIAHAAIRLPTSLVPCGTSANPAQCNPCHLWLLADNVINFILWMSLPILVIALLYGGIIWLISVGNTANVQRGKTIIFNAIVGILIAFMGWLIVDSIIKTLAAGRPVAAWNTAPSCEMAIVLPPPPPPPPPAGLSCNPSNQCVQGGGGKVCSQNSDCVVLQCSASSISALTQAMLDCVIAGAPSIGIQVNRPQNNQLNGGCHACPAPNTPSPGCTNTGSIISCHYGGTKCNGKGNAADFTLASGQNGENWDKLRNLAISCSPANGGARCERGSITVNCRTGSPDHVHANASSACGCN